MYQASASNIKGIVSCSGVLEVGEMNEFKIHQRYFAKIKQKAESRRREAEGKENQEPLRTISPDRTQRKRRSTMEAFLSTPSSTEDESSEESNQVVASETEARLQEATVEEVKEKLVPITNGAVSAVIKGQAISENGRSEKSEIHIYDSAQKIFTAHQPKTPFVKKKIKISNSAKVAKSDAPALPASEQRRAKDETSASSALACKDPVQSVRNSEEVMEVENIVSSPVVDSDSRNVTEQHQRSDTEEVSLVEMPSKVEKDVTVASQKEQITALVLPAPLTSANHTVSGTECKEVAKTKIEEADGHKDTKESQNQHPHTTSTLQDMLLQSSAVAVPQQTLRIAKEDISKTEDDTVMDVDEKSTTSTGASIAHRGIDSVNILCESRTVLPQRPCEQAGDQLPEKETSPCQQAVSVSQPALLSEVSEPFRMSS